MSDFHCDHCGDRIHYDIRLCDKCDTVERIEKRHDADLADARQAGYDAARAEFECYRRSWLEVCELVGEFGRGQPDKQAAFVAVWNKLQDHINVKRKAGYDEGVKAAIAQGAVKLIMPQVQPLPEEFAQHIRDAYELGLRDGKRIAARS